MSLAGTIEQVLAKASSPVPVGEIVERVQATGYRSSSANFRALLNMTLVKDDRFQSAGRGLYVLKGAKRSKRATRQAQPGESRRRSR